MTLQTRRIIYITFIAIFLVVTPIILYYTAGYRYDFKKNKMLKTGGIFLLVKEPQAQIYLNGELKKESGIIFNNEIRFNNLLPNNYHVAVKKEGYYPWEKTLPVYSQQTTFAEHITMFLNKEPEQISSTPAETIFLSPNQKYLAYLELNENIAEIWLLNRTSGERELIYRINCSSLNLLDKEKPLSWSTDSQKILLATAREKAQKSYLVIDLGKNDRLELDELLEGTELNSLSWGTSNSNILYGNEGNIIYEINLLDNSISPAITSEEKNIITDFYRNGNDFWYLAQNENESLLLKKNIWNAEEAVLRLEKDEYSFIPHSPEKIFSFLGKNKQRIFLIEKDTLNILLDEYALQAQWSRDKNRLLYYTDLELWYYNLEEKKKELISRYSQEINTANWIPNADYVIFLLGGDLRIIELDGRDQRNFYHLTENVILNNFTINEDGGWIYYSSGEGENSGLYKLQIR